MPSTAGEGGALGNGLYSCYLRFTSEFLLPVTTKATSREGLVPLKPPVAGCLLAAKLCTREALLTATCDTGVGGHVGGYGEG